LDGDPVRTGPSSGDADLDRDAWSLATLVFVTATSDSPLPVLHAARVLAYAVVDSSVEYTERQTLYVGGELLGPVPRLAKGQA
jgi:hypothetical protein